jgi:hypothetical protein
LERYNSNPCCDLRKMKKRMRKKSKVNPNPQILHALRLPSGHQPDFDHQYKVKK